MDEIWEDISGFEGSYQVSNLGRVRSLSRWIPNPANGGYMQSGQMLRLHPDKDGYTTVTLNLNGFAYPKKVHRLVGSAFIANPDNKPEVNHKDGIRNRNTSDNLEWNTVSENKLHAFRELGRKVGTERRIRAVDGKGEVLLFECVMEAKREGFNRARIYEVIGKEARYHRGFKWEYVNG